MDRPPEDIGTSCDHDLLQSTGVLINLNGQLQISSKIF